MPLFKVVDKNSDPGKRDLLVLQEQSSGDRIPIYHDGLYASIPIDYEFDSGRKNPKEHLRDLVVGLRDLRKELEEWGTKGKRPVVFFFVGENFSGKTSTLRALSEEFGVPEVISHTTRPAREGEAEGKDYFFVTEKEFMETPMVERVSFGGKRYGLALSSLKDAIGRSPAVGLVADPNGIKAIRKFIRDTKLPLDTHVIYMNPENRLEIGERMVLEGKISREDLDSRISRGDITADLKRLGIEADLTITRLDGQTLAEVAGHIAPYGIEERDERKSGMESACLPDIDGSSRKLLFSFVDQMIESGDSDSMLIGENHPGRLYSLGLKEGAEAVKDIILSSESRGDLFESLKKALEKAKNEHQREVECSGGVKVGKDAEDPMTRPTIAHGGTTLVESVTVGTEEARLAGMESAIRRFLDYAGGLIELEKGSDLAVNTAAPSPGR